MRRVSAFPLPRQVVLTALIAAVAGAGCATKGDIRDLREEVSALADRQSRDLTDFETLLRASQDTLSGQSSLFLQLRGDLLQQLDEIRELLLTLGESLGQNQRAMAALRDRVEMLQRAPVVVPDSSETGVAEEVAEGPDALFEVTTVLYNRGSNVTARRGFDQFLATYPNHELAGHATFFLSDLDVQEGRIEEAIEGFMRVPQMYPASPMVPDALYRAAILHEELGESEEARNLLERVVSGFPDSGVAELAEQRLQGIP